MNIILVSSRLAKAVSLGPRQLLPLLLFASFVVGGVAFTLGALVGGSYEGAALTRLVPGARQAEVDALAVRLGELQAQMLRLDGLAKQVGKRAGIDVAPFLSGEVAPRGGVSQSGSSLTVDELLKQLSGTEALLGAYQDQLSLAEAVLLLPGAGNLPTGWPLPPDSARSSSFGSRIDPFNGRQTFHEGIDFVAEIGSSVKASGNGVVTFAGYHSEYGNMVNLDHGNGLISRYAHNSKLLVRTGDKVSAGQVISLLGNTGRSTGAHLHYEIRYKNVPQNPLRFLAAGSV